MTDFNFAISVAILTLSVGLGVYHVHRFGWHMAGMSGVVVLVLASLGVVTAIGAWMPGQQDYLRFAAAVLRGMALVLLISFALYHWREA